MRLSVKVMPKKRMLVAMMPINITRSEVD